MGRGREVGAARPLEGDADRVVDEPGRDLVVADEPGQDRQARRVGRGPAVGALRQVLPELEDARLVGLPRLAVLRREGAVELDQPARFVGVVRVLLEDEHVAVAVGAPAALDPRLARDRMRPGVALVGIRLELHLHALLVGGHDLERDAVVRVRAEVGVKGVAAVGEDPVDHRLGVLGLVETRDVLVERVGLRQDLAAAGLGRRLAAWRRRGDARAREGERGQGYGRKAGRVARSSSPFTSARAGRLLEPQAPSGNDCLSSSTGAKRSPCSSILAEDVLGLEDQLVVSVRRPPRPRPT